MVGRASPIPLYYQLKSYLLEQIGSGGWQPGQMLPSERQLQEQFAVSRATVRQAVSELVNQGILERRQGVGTMVARQKITPQLLRLTSFSEDMQSRGLQPGSITLQVEVVVPPPRVRERLELMSDAPILSVYRLRLANDEPIGLQKFYIPPWLSVQEADLAVLPSYYKFLEQRGVYVTRARETLAAKNATATEARLLQVAHGQALLDIERTTYDTLGRPVEHVQFVYRADRYQYEFSLQR